MLSGRLLRSLLWAAAVVLAVFVAAGFFLRLYSERSGWSSASTAIGDYRRLPLVDGSTLELNTASEVRYRLSADVRELDLRAGEARFRVAHEVGRPFVVVARDTVVRAVGTEFTVRIRENGKVDVLVAEGVVAVSHLAHESVVRELFYGRKLPLVGGTSVPEKRMITDDGGKFGVAEITGAKIEARDSWRNNMLVFDETMLKEIVAEFNRYNRRKLEIMDPAIGEVAISVKYSPRDVDGFLQHLGVLMKIRVEEEPGSFGEPEKLRIYPAGR